MIRSGAVKYCKTKIRFLFGMTGAGFFLGEERTLRTLRTLRTGRVKKYFVRWNGGDSSRRLSLVPRSSFSGWNRRRERAWGYAPQTRSRSMTCTTRKLLTAISRMLWDPLCHCALTSNLFLPVLRPFSPPPSSPLYKKAGLQELCDPQKSAIRSKVFEEKGGGFERRKRKSLSPLS